MASLEEIQIYLNIDLNRRLRDGKKQPLKNRYYYYRGKYYCRIVTEHVDDIRRLYNNKTFIRKLCLVCTK